MDPTISSIASNQFRKSFLYWPILRFSRRRSEVISVRVKLFDWNSFKSEAIIEVKNAKKGAPIRTRDLLTAASRAKRAAEHRYDRPERQLG